MHPRPFRQAAVATCLLAALLPASACGDNTTGSGGDADGNASPAGGGGGDRPLVGLITKTDADPFFIKMREGATEEAQKAGFRLQAFAGKDDGDHESQVAAIESLISSGAKGVLITPADPKAIGPELEKARKAGMATIALDTPTDPADAADATYATDNFHAGQLIGQWAKAKFAAENKTARIALLDFSADQITVDVQRDQGFLDGFGVDIKDKNKFGDETDPRISGHALTGANEEGGRTGIETLLQKDPDINLVYTINEATASGAVKGIQAAGKTESITVVSIDASCTGIKLMKAKQLAATSAQYPVKMASLGIEALAKFDQSGQRPTNSPGKPFFDTGTQLITDEPQSGQDSKDSTYGQSVCFG